MPRLSELRPQLRRFVRATVWLARDGAASARGAVLAIVATDLVGVLTGASSMGLAIWYLDWAQSPRPIAPLGVAIPLTTGPASMLAVGAAALAAGVLSAACIYGSERLVQHVTRTYQKACMARIMQIACDPHLGRILAAIDHAPAGLTSVAELLGGGARYTAYAMRAIVQLVLPITTLVVAFAVLFWTNAMITAIVVIMLAGYSAPLYVIYRRVGRNQRDYRALTRIVYADLKRRLASFRRTSGPIRDARALWEELLLDSDDFRRMQDALYGRVLGTRQVAFANNVLFVLCVFAIFAMIGLLGGPETVSWANLLAYIVALRFAWGSLRRVTGLLTSVSQFFPEFEKYVDLRRAAARVAEAPAEEERTFARTSRRVAARGALPDLPAGDRSDVALCPGATLLVLHPSVIDWVALERVADLLSTVDGARTDLPAGSFYHESAEPIAGLGVRENALGDDPAPDRAAALPALLDHLGVLEEITRVAGGLEAPLAAAHVRALSPEARYAITAAYVALLPSDAALLALAGLAELRPEFIEALLDALEDRCVLLVDAVPRRALRPPLAGLLARLDGVVVALDDETIACGSRAWYEARIDEIDAVVGARLEALERTAADADDALDELD